MTDQLRMDLHRPPYLRANRPITWIYGRQATASYDPPPIPGWEKMAWKASFDDDEGKPVGYGATSSEAFEDLRQQSEDKRLSIINRGEDA